MFRIGDYRNKYTKNLQNLQRFSELTKAFSMHLTLLASKKGVFLTFLFQ